MARVLDVPAIRRSCVRNDGRTGTERLGIPPALSTALRILLFLDHNIFISLKHKYFL
jgi:hypothetical protein